MVNAYKNWTDQQLVDNGKRLTELIPIAWRNLRAMPNKTDLDLYEISKVIGIISDAERTRIILRNEWRQRNGHKTV